MISIQTVHNIHQRYLHVSHICKPDPLFVHVLLVNPYYSVSFTFTSVHYTYMLSYTGRVVSHTIMYL